MRGLANEDVTTIARLLLDRGETVSIAESTSGGLISASLLSYPGASGYYRGGSVVYTLPSRREFLSIDRDRVEGVQPLSEEMAAIFADAARDKLGATWGIAELGAAGPTGSRYGHDAGTSVIGVSGQNPLTTRIETGSNDRESNMYAFADAALALFANALEQASE